jgi:uncharacterized protein
MNAALPETVDAWRMVTARRLFEGSVPLASMPRLRDSLTSASGSVSYEIEFGKDSLGVANIWLRAQADLPLLCQRSLESFDFPVRIDTRLGMIEDESDEAGLPPGYDPLLVEKNGQLRLADVIEDELILALPVVPLKPGVDPVERTWRGDETEESDAKPNPFSVLQNMKVSKK